MKSLHPYNSSVYTLIILLFCILPVSCTKVVDVDVPNGGERLIIEGNINWEKGTPGSNQTIILSLSTPFFEQNKFTPASNAQVKVTNAQTQDVFTFTEQEPGYYRTSDFVPVINAVYNLEVIYNEDRYTATETLQPVSSITKIEQGSESGFGEESIQLSVFVQDPANIKNHYYIEFIQPQDNIMLGREVETDQFSDGNEMNLEFDTEDFTVGDQVDITVFGISEGYYNYMSLLLEQSGGQGGPFSTLPAKLIGNCINQTNPDKETLGYFRLSEQSSTTYTIQ